MSSTTTPTTEYTYAGSGVDVAAGDAFVEQIKPLVAATHRPGAMGGIGGFGGIFDPKATGYKDPLLVSATDGVGTKLLVAIETGALDGIGQDLVAMCVNDLVCQGAEPLYFLDYFATGKLDPRVASRVVASIARACKDANCALIGGETAEMPAMYADGHFDLAGFAVGMVEREALLPRSDTIVAGDRLVGWKSSGIHSNGWSLVRQIVGDYGGWEATPPWGGTMTDLMAPTALYVHQALANRETAKAFAHITGGGTLGNIPRVLPDSLDAVIEDGAFPSVPFYDFMVNEDQKLSLEEAHRTFNMGIGLVAVIAADAPLPQGAIELGALVAGTGTCRLA